MSDLLITSLDLCIYLLTQIVIFFCLYNSWNNSSDRNLNVTQPYQTQPRQLWPTFTLPYLINLS
jgi:hypothetical protein